VERDLVAEKQAFEDYVSRVTASVKVVAAEQEVAA
jgi:hypothetical protein